MRLGRVALIAALGALVALVVASGVVAWLSVRGEEPVQPRARRRADAAGRGAGLARRIPRACRRLRHLPHRTGRPAVGRRPRCRDAVRQRLQLEPHARCEDRPRRLVGRRVLARPAQRPRRATGACSTRPFHIRTSPASPAAMPTRCSPICKACPPSIGRIAGTRLRFPVDTQVALALWRALYFRPEPYREDATPVGRMESRRLSGRGPRPLQRLSFGTQRARRHVRPARPARRPDPGAELVRALARFAARSGRRRLAARRGRAPAEGRRRQAGLRHGADERGRRQEHAIPERRRRRGDGGLSAIAAGTGERDGCRRRRTSTGAEPVPSSTKITASAATARRAKACPAPTRRWPAAAP